MKNQFSNTLTDEEEDGKESSSNPEEPEYSFPGYSIEVNQKIVLTPATPMVKA